MTVGILSGSSRQNSNTGKVGMAIERILIANGVAPADIRRPDFAKYDLPFMNGGDVIKEALTPFQKDVYETMRDSRLIFVLSPEYNWFPSPEIINLVNHYGNRDMAECWENKTFATCGVSAGAGGRIPAVQLSYLVNKIINVMDFRSIVSAKMFESMHTAKSLDANGNSLGNEIYDAGLEKFVRYNLEFIRE